VAEDRHRKGGERCGDGPEPDLATVVLKTDLLWHEPQLRAFRAEIKLLGPTRLGSKFPYDIEAIPAMSHPKNSRRSA
jgi:hypothetical protein